MISVDIFARSRSLCSGAFRKTVCLAIVLPCLGCALIAAVFCLPFWLMGKIGALLGLDENL